MKLRKSITSVKQLVNQQSGDQRRLGNILAEQTYNVMLQRTQVGTTPEYVLSKCQKMITEGQYKKAFKNLRRYLMNGRYDAHTQLRLCHQILYICGRLINKYLLLRLVQMKAKLPKLLKISFEYLEMMHESLNQFDLNDNWVKETKAQVQKMRLTQQEELEKLKKSKNPMGEQSPTTLTKMQQKRKRHMINHRKSFENQLSPRSSLNSIGAGQLMMFSNMVSSNSNPYEENQRQMMVKEPMPQQNGHSLFGNSSGCLSEDRQIPPEKQQNQQQNQLGIQVGSNFPSSRSITMNNNNINSNCNSPRNGQLQPQQQQGGLSIKRLSFMQQQQSRKDSDQEDNEDEDDQSPMFMRKNPSQASFITQQNNNNNYTVRPDPLGLVQSKKEDVGGQSSNTNNNNSGDENNNINDCDLSSDAPLIKQKALIFQFYVEDLATSELQILISAYRYHRRVDERDTAILYLNAAVNAVQSQLPQEKRNAEYCYQGALAIALAGNIQLEQDCCTEAAQLFEQAFPHAQNAVERQMRLISQVDVQRLSVSMELKLERYLHLLCLLLLSWGLACEQTRDLGKMQNCIGLSQWLAQKLLLYENMAEPIRDLVEEHLERVTLAYNDHITEIADLNKIIRLAWKEELGGLLKKEEQVEDPVSVQLREFQNKMYKKFRYDELNKQQQIIFKSKQYNSNNLNFSANDIQEQMQQGGNNKLNISNIQSQREERSPSTSMVQVCQNSFYGGGQGNQQQQSEVLIVQQLQQSQRMRMYSNNNSSQQSLQQQQLQTEGFPQNQQMQAKGIVKGGYNNSNMQQQQQSNGMINNSSNYRTNVSTSNLHEQTAATAHNHNNFNTINITNLIGNNNNNENSQFFDFNSQANLSRPQSGQIHHNFQLQPSTTTAAQEYQQNNNNQRNLFKVRPETAKSYSHNKKNNNNNDINNNQQEYSEQQYQDSNILGSNEYMKASLSRDLMNYQITNDLNSLLQQNNINNSSILGNQTVLTHNATNLYLNNNDNNSKQHEEEGIKKKTLNKKSSAAAIIQSKDKHDLNNNNNSSPNQNQKKQKKWEEKLLNSPPSQQKQKQQNSKTNSNNQKNRSHSPSPQNPVHDNYNQSQNYTQNYPQHNQNQSQNSQNIQQSQQIFKNRINSRPQSAQNGQKLNRSIRNKTVNALSDFFERNYPMHSITNPKLLTTDKYFQSFVHADPATVPAIENYEERYDFYLLRKEQEFPDQKQGAKNLDRQIKEIIVNKLQRDNKTADYINQFKGFCYTMKNEDFDRKEFGFGKQELIFLQKFCNSQQKLHSQKDKQENENFTKICEHIQMNKEQTIQKLKMQKVLEAENQNIQKLLQMSSGMLTPSQQSSQQQQQQQQLQLQQSTSLKNQSRSLQRFSIITDRSQERLLKNNDQKSPLQPGSPVIQGINASNNNSANKISRTSQMQKQQLKQQEVLQQQLQQKGQLQQNYQKPDSIKQQQQPSTTTVLGNTRKINKSCIKLPIKEQQVINPPVEDKEQEQASLENTIKKEAMKSQEVLKSFLVNIELERDQIDQKLISEVNKKFKIHKTKKELTLDNNTLDTQTATNTSQTSKIKLFSDNYADLAQSTKSFTSKIKIQKNSQLFSELQKLQGNQIFDKLNISKQVIKEEKIPKRLVMKQQKKLELSSKTKNTKF